MLGGCLDGAAASHWVVTIRPTEYGRVVDLECCHPVVDDATASLEAGVSRKEEIVGLELELLSQPSGRGLITK